MAPESEPPPRVPWLPVSEGVDPAAPDDEHDAFHPIVPAWINRDTTRVQEPEATEAKDPAPAVAPPAPAEVLPQPGTQPSAVDEAPLPMPHDPVQLLGESAVTSASLSAAGAPTPLGGVPAVPTRNAITPPDFGEGVAFVPTFEAGLAPPPPSQAKADALAAGIVAHERDRLASQAPHLDAGTAYTPLAFGETQLEREETSGRNLWWLWIVLAAAVMAGLGITYAILNRPDPTVIPGATVTEPAPSPTIVPSPAPTGTAFQASMPATVGLFSLVSSVPLEPADLARTFGRVADGVDLAYRSGEVTMTVRALQYFTQDEATESFTTLAGQDAATRPVTAGGATVGASAIVTAPKPGIVWRNGTSVFILTGPPLEVSAFFERFAL